jgi:hypothetical protein
MLERLRKSLVRVVLLLCLVGSALTVYGKFLATSNIVHVDIQYTVELSRSGGGRNVNLNARVSFNGSPVGAGVNVNFYYSFNGGGWVLFASDTTNGGGNAHASYRIIVNGSYDFRAVVSGMKVG